MPSEFSTNVHFLVQGEKIQLIAFPVVLEDELFLWTCVFQMQLENFQVLGFLISQTLMHLEVLRTPVQKELVFLLTQDERFASHEDPLPVAGLVWWIHHNASSTLRCGFFDACWISLHPSSGPNWP